MSNTIQCYNCGEHNDADNAFCIFCGIKMNAVPAPPPPPPESQVCPDGHVYNDMSLLFCPTCGKPFKGGPVPPPPPPPPEPPVPGPGTMMAPPGGDDLTPKNNN